MIKKQLSKPIKAACLALAAILLTHSAAELFLRITVSLGSDRLSSGFSELTRAFLGANPWRLAFFAAAALLLFLLKAAAHTDGEAEKDAPSAGNALFTALTLKLTLRAVTDILLSLLRHLLPSPDESEVGYLTKMLIPTVNAVSTALEAVFTVALICTAVIYISSHLTAKKEKAPPAPFGENGAASPKGAS